MYRGYRLYFGRFINSCFIKRFATKTSLFAGQRYKRCNRKILCRNNFCLCSKSNKLLNSNSIIACHVKTNDFRVGIHHDLFIYFFFVSLFVPTDVMKSILLLFSSKEKISFYDCIVIYLFFLPLLLNTMLYIYIYI